MHKRQVKTPEQALIYITECNLSTIASMALLKKRANTNLKGKFPLPN